MISHIHIDNKRTTITINYKNQYATKMAKREERFLKANNNNTHTIKAKLNIIWRFVDSGGGNILL